MANRYPLILDTTDANKIKELQTGDNLNLADNSIVGVQNITAVISNLRKQGYLVKRTKIPFIKALVRINEKVKVQVPKNLPVKDIEISEYWISK